MAWQIEFGPNADKALTKLGIEKTELALRAEIREVELALKADIREVELGLKADIEKTKLALQVEIQETKGAIHQSKVEIIKWVIAILIIQFGALTAIMAKGFSWLGF